jgi:hypothetical protein
LEQKEQLIDELQNLQRDLNRLADGATDDPRAERRFREAASAIRDGQLPDRVDFSRGLVASSRPEQAQEFEAQISELMEDLNEQVQAAAGSLDPDAQNRASELAERTRELVRAAESMEERARQAMEDQQQGGQQQGGGDQIGGSRLGGGPGGGFDDRVARQLRREAGERRFQTEELRDRLAEAGVPAESLEGLIKVVDRFRDLEARGIYGDPRALSELQQELIESLRELDFDVRRHFGAENREGPIVAGTGDVPEGYQDLVEEYFRSLAR